MRNYNIDLAGGTATASVQITGNGTLKSIAISIVNAAAGKLEISTSPTSQIGTAAPTSDVILRLTQSATAGPAQMIEVGGLNTPLKAFQYLYFHSTGAGNLGNASFRV